MDGTGFAFGKWLSRQKDNPKFGEDKKALLTDLGVCMEKADSWEKRYALAKQFYHENGHLRVLARYYADGVDVYKWLNEQQKVYLGKREGKSLSDEQIKRLEAIGMAWGKAML